MARRGAWFWCGVIVCAACGGENKVVSTPPQLVAQKSPHPLPHTAARWFFPTPASGVNDKLDLGDGSMLLVGDQGRREIIRDGKATDAESLIPDRILGIIRDDQQHYVFISDEADAYVAREPLGPFEAHRHSFGDSAEIWGVSTGRNTAFVRLSDGRALRTADAGASWKPLEYAGAKLFGHIASLDIDRDGNGVLIRVPQRLYVTHDDGATWKPIPSPSIGAWHCMDDARGGFLVLGYDHHYTKLVGDALVPTDEVPRDLATLALPLTPRSKRNVEVVSVVAGGHLVEVERARDKNTVRVRSTGLGGEPGRFSAVHELETRSTFIGRVAAWGSYMVAVRTDSDTDENTPTSTVLTSSDGGATWKPAVTLEGDSPLDRERVVVGPKGWTFVPSLCGVFGEQHARNCSPAKVRSAASTTFDDLLFTEELRPLRFAFDEAHDKVYALGEYNGKGGVYESSLLGQNKFRPIAVPVHVGSAGRAQITVTGDGSLHVFQYDATKAAVVLTRRDAAGKEMPTLYLPTAQVATDTELRSMAFAGARGVIMNGKAFGWETADGGLTWIRVAANGALTPECAEAGCLAGDAQRIGWDLPTPTDAPKVSATSDAPTQEARDPDPLQLISPAPPRMTIACKVSGAETHIAFTPAFDNVTERRDVYWYLEEDSAGKKAIAIGGRSGIRHETLLEAVAAPPKGVVRFVGQRVMADGIVAGRYTFREGQPIDVELGIFSLETGRVQHVTLPKLPSFRVAEYGFTGDIGLVTGGSLYQPTDASPAFFIHDDGKVERVPLPSHATLTSAQRLDGSWLLFGFDDRALVKLTWSTNNGGSWQERAWLANNASNAVVSLIRGGGRGWISTNLQEGEAFYPVGAAPAEDLPNPVMPEASMEAVCDPHMTFSESFNIPTHGDTVHTTIDLGDKSPPRPVDLEGRIIHVTAAGTICTLGYVLQRQDLRVALYHDKTSSYFGWVFRTPADFKDRLAAPVTCTTAP